MKNGDEWSERWEEATDVKKRNQGKNISYLQREKLGRFRNKNIFRSEKLYSLIFVRNYIKVWHVQQYTVVEYDSN